MDTDEIIDRLRNPQKYNTPVTPKATAELKPEQEIIRHPVKKKTGVETVVGITVVVLLLLTVVFWMVSKHKAENLTAALDPEQVQGLYQEEDFNPSSGISYLELQEGQDRNVSVSNLGSTLPIISRFNVKTLTDRSYEIIGAAPWALTTNFASNLTDPELMGYLLANDTMIQAFLNRPDVAPLLEDPQMLLAFVQDENTLKAFFEDGTVQAVLSNPQMVRTIAGSRFMSHLLISKAAKYFRNRPQEAVQIIDQHPSLSALRRNQGIVAALKENPYLKTIADTLLTPGKPVKAAGPAATSTTKKSTASKKTGKKKNAKK